MDAIKEGLTLEIFEDALGWPEDEIDARLVSRCGGDKELEAVVRRLLERDRSAGLLLPTMPPRVDEPKMRAPPERIGPYRLVDVLGVGGMGTVYRAEREDGLFQQTVAVKLVRQSLLSLATTERFVEERRILARLRHPNIAQLFDGGTDPSGHAYIIMEYLEGEPITSFVGRGASPAPTVLQLFRRVCDAVQYAHQNLIVHADIKPSNILVTPDGTVKLLDFGIARLVDKVGGVTSDSAGGEPMTQGYAAPERQNGQAPTVSSDIYSLGAVLHELLTGKLPGEAAARITPGDLDAVLRKALAADPARRYASVERFADDLHRSQKRLPVSALPRTWKYTAGLFVRRHRLGVGLTAVAVLGLAAATSITSALYVSAERARAEADLRFGELRDLSKFMIFDLYDELTRIPGATATRLRVADKAQQYLDGLAALPGSPYDVKLETGIGFGRLASVLGVPAQPNLGDLQAARSNLAKAHNQLAALHTAAPERTDVAIELARVLLLQARTTIWADQKSGDAHPLIERAAALIDAHRSLADPKWLDARLLLQEVGIDAADWENRPESVIVLARKTLDELEAWPAELRGDERHVVAHARALMKLGDGIYYTGDRPGALHQYRAADLLLREAGGRLPDRPSIYSARVTAGWSIATTLVNIERASEAPPVFEETLEVLGRLAEFEKHDQALDRQRLLLESARAEALSILGRHAEAVAGLQASMVHRRARFDAAPEDASRARDLAFGRLTLGDAYWRGADHRRGCSEWSESFAGLQKLHRDGELNAWDVEDTLAQLQTRADVCAGRQPESALGF